MINFISVLKEWGFISDPDFKNRTVLVTGGSRGIGQPDEIADVVQYLLSEKSKFMMGQTLVASGGRVMLP